MDNKDCNHFYVFLEKEITFEERPDGNRNVTTKMYLRVCQHCGDSVSI